MNITRENMKTGTVLLRDGKRFITLKCNQTSFYCQEFKQNGKQLLDNFENKPRKYKIEEYIVDNHVVKAKYSDPYQIKLDEFFVSVKTNKKLSPKISVCCADEVVDRFKRKTNKFGRGECRKCKKDFASIKIEDKEWVTYSQDKKFFAVNVNTFELKEWEVKSVRRNEKKDT